MDGKQYRNLVWHLLYTESLLENVAEATGGGKCECPICKSRFPGFFPYGEVLRKNAQCPNCKSLERHRALWLLLERLNWHHENMRVLHFAPETIFYQLFSSFKDIDYWPVDLEPDNYGGRVRKAVDITNIPFEDDSFDLIMCTHVLEHIPDDIKAMRELYRVLKPDTGIALLNVPIFNRPYTLENPEYNTPELRTKYYGQSDHIRAYGLDYPQRLESVGFTVQSFVTENMNDADFKRYGLIKGELFFSRKEQFYGKFCAARY